MYFKFKRNKAKFSTEIIASEFQSLLEMLTRYLGLFCVALIPLFIFNWHDPTWHSPWSLITWLIFLLFNIAWSQFTKKSKRYANLDQFRIFGNYCFVVAMFYLTGGAQNNFWYCAAVSAIGATTSIYLARGKVYLITVSFVLVYCGLYFSDLEQITVRSVQDIVPIVVLLAISGLLFVRVTGIIGQKSTELLTEKEKIRKTKLEKEEAKAASLAKSRFLAHMNHELRTPLAAIAGFTDLLSSARVSAKEQKKFFKIVQRNIRHLSALVDDILDLSKVEAGELITEHVSIDLIKEVGSVMELLAPQAKDKSIQLECSYLSPVPDFLFTDPTRMRQILINIIGNAIKFTGKGRVKVSIRFQRAAKEKSKGKIIFIVEDTGCGISFDKVDLIFDPFTQADISISRKFGGTGLGLPLSRKLARALGGDVELLKTAVGNGSVFQISIATETLKGTQVVTPEKLPPEAGDFLKSQTNQLKDMNILVVDDNEDTLTLLKSILTEVGAQIEVATNGYEGVQATQKKEFDVVLMDLKMPVMDGHCAVSQIKKNGYCAPVIALTANATIDEKKRAIASGFDDYQTKPISPIKLIDLLVTYKKSNF